MKSYTITVNGTAYEVTVEERGSAAAPAPAPAAAPAPAPAPAAAPAPPPPPPAPACRRNMKYHKVVKIVAEPGQALKPGDSIVILESMKMEIPIVAPQEGTLASIDTTEGASVENGDILATMN